MICGRCGGRSSPRNRLLHARFSNAWNSSWPVKASNPIGFINPTSISFNQPQSADETQWWTNGPSPSSARHLPVICPSRNDSSPSQTVSYSTFILETLHNEPVDYIINPASSSLSRSLSLSLSLSLCFLPLVVTNKRRNGQTNPMPPSSIVRLGFSSIWASLP